MKITTSLVEMKRSLGSNRFNGAIALLWLIGTISVPASIGFGSNIEADAEPATEYESEGESEEQTSSTEPSSDIVISDKEEQFMEQQAEVEADEVKPYVILSDEELEALACLIWLEGGCESVECQEAIASTIINRYTSNPNTYQDLFDVIYEPSQFSPAYMIVTTEPQELQMSIAMKIATEGPTIPEYVTFFRANYFHSWGDQVPYMHMDHTYFSYSASLKEQLTNEEVTK